MDMEDIGESGSNVALSGVQQDGQGRKIDQWRQKTLREKVEEGSRDCGLGKVVDRYSGVSCNSKIGILEFKDSEGAVLLVNSKEEK